MCVLRSRWSPTAAHSRPRGDYSLGSFANGLRDLLATLGHKRVTLVGQSLGGGVAMQFAYQFPALCERLALVASGGLGEEVHTLLRVLTLPGAEYVLPLTCTTWIHDTVASIVGALQRVGLRPGANLIEVWDSYGSLTDSRTRTTFLQTLRSVVDTAGQRVSARDRLYLTSTFPTLIIWGDHDKIIPVTQVHATHQAVPGSRLEIFEGVGHFPHCERPQQFVDVLTDFMHSTSPGGISPERWPGMSLGTSSSTTTVPALRQRCANTL